MKITNRMILLACFTSLLLLIGCTGSRYSHDPAYLKCKEEKTQDHCMTSGGQYGCDPSSRDICMLSLALNRSDASICDEIDPWVPTDWPFSQNFGDLRHSNQSYSNLCRNEVAISRNESLCNPRANQTFEVACYRYAISKMDFRICEGMGGSAKDECYIKMVYNDPKKIHDWSICGNISTNCEFCEVDCNFYAALQTSNVSYCDNLRKLKPINGWRSDLYTDYNCYEGLACAKLDHRICYGAENPDICLNGAAVCIYSNTSDYNHSMGICQNITNESIKLDCDTWIEKMSQQ